MLREAEGTAQHRRARPGAAPASFSPRPGTTILLDASPAPLILHAMTLHIRASCVAVLTLGAAASGVRAGPRARRPLLPTAARSSSATPATPSPPSGSPGPPPRSRARWRSGTPRARSQAYKAVVAPDASVPLIEVTVREDAGQRAGQGEGGPAGPGHLQGGQRGGGRRHQPRTCRPGCSAPSGAPFPTSTCRSRCWSRPCAARARPAPRRAGAVLQSRRRADAWTRKVSPLGTDSLALAIGSVEFHLGWIRRGRVLGGRIPAQNVVAERSELIAVGRVSEASGSASRLPRRSRSHLPYTRPRHSTRRSPRQVRPRDDVERHRARRADTPARRATGICIP